MRIVFLGSPAAAVPTLRTLVKHHEVLAAVTQPDRPRGRSRRPSPTPVKIAALDEGIPVIGPASESELVSALKDLGEIDVGVVVAYGRILRHETLNAPKHGMVNVHFSLLPRWRGAAPVPRALMAGDEMSGVTIIQLDEGLDTGPVLTAQAVDVGAEETAGELTGRLAGLGSRLLLSCIDAYVAGGLVPVPQSNDGATYAKKLTPSDRDLDPSLPASELVNRVRALSPEPGANLVLDGETIKVLRAEATESGPEVGVWAGSGNGRVVVGVGGGGLVLTEIQPPGKRAMDSADWLRGRRRKAGNTM